MKIEIILEITAQVILCLMSLSVYVFLVSNVIPTHIFKIRYDMSDHLGRGLRKFTYPDGRAVTYEPHPSVRKYINKYALFTLDGYKYLQLKNGDVTKSYSARVITFNNRHRIIDILDITESLSVASTSSPIRLNDKTSYIALILNEANGKKICNQDYMKMTVEDMVKYLIAMFVFTLAEALHIVATMNGVSAIAENMKPLEVNYATALLPALIVALLCLAVTLGVRMKKGVKVALK